MTLKRACNLLTTTHIRNFFHACSKSRFQFTRDFDIQSSKVVAYKHWDIEVEHKFFVCLF
jgi:hypothetical protein